MTTLVKYNMGPHYSRVLGAADLKKAGVEGFTSTTFPGGVFVEVEDAVATALTDPNSVLFEKGEFVTASPAEATTEAQVPGDEELLEDDSTDTSTSGSKKK